MGPALLGHKLEGEVILTSSTRGSARLWGVCTRLLCHPWMLFRAGLHQLLALFPARKGQGNQQVHNLQKMSSSGAGGCPCAEEALGWHQDGLCPSMQLALPAGVVASLAYTQLASSMGALGESSGASPKG